MRVKVVPSGLSVHAVFDGDPEIDLRIASHRLAIELLTLGFDARQGQIGRKGTVIVAVACRRAEDVVEACREVQDAVARTAGG